MKSYCKRCDKFVKVRPHSRGVTCTRCGSLVFAQPREREDEEKEK